MDKMNYFPATEMEHNVWTDVSDRNFYAIIEQTDRGPFIQVPTNGLKTHGIYLFPDKHLRAVTKGEIVRITKVCLKATFGFFRSVPVTNLDDVENGNFLHMGQFTSLDLEDVQKTKEQQVDNT